MGAFDERAVEDAVCTWLMEAGVPAAAIRRQVSFFAKEHPRRVGAMDITVGYDIDWPLAIIEVKRRGFCGYRGERWRATRSQLARYLAAHPTAGVGLLTDGHAAALAWSSWGQRIEFEQIDVSTDAFVGPVFSRFLAELSEGALDACQPADPLASGFTLRPSKVATRRKPNRSTGCLLN